MNSVIERLNELILIMKKNFNHVVACSLCKQCLCNKTDVFTVPGADGL
jgi:hypothetical protein